VQSSSEERATLVGRQRFQPRSGTCSPLPGRQVDACPQQDGCRGLQGYGETKQGRVARLGRLGLEVLEITRIQARSLGDVLDTEAELTATMLDPTPDVARPAERARPRHRRTSLRFWSIGPRS